MFQNEALIFETSDGQMFVADSYSKSEYLYYEDSFSGVSTRNFTLSKKLKSSEVIYLKYNNFALRNLLSSMADSYQELMSSANDRYNKSVGHKGILEIGTMATNSNDFQKRFLKLVNEDFKKYFQEKNAVLPLYDGFKYNEPSTDAGNKSTNNEINDIEKLKTEIFSNVANCFHVPPALIFGTASQLDDSVNAFISNAIDPLANMLEQEITKKKYGQAEYLKGNYMLVDTTTIRHIDAVSQANNIDKAIACGVLSPYKAQKYSNMLPCSDEWAKSYYITKNYQSAAETLKGGESKNV